MTLQSIVVGLMTPKRLLMLCLTRTRTARQTMSAGLVERATGATSYMAAGSGAGGVTLALTTSMAAAVYKRATAHVSSWSNSFAHVV